MLFRSSEDPDDDSLSYLWGFIEVPAGSTASLSSSDTDTSGFTPDVVGTYRVRLTVDDGSLTHVASVEVDVAANQKPTANAGPDQTSDRKSVGSG